MTLAEILRVVGLFLENMAAENRHARTQWENIRRATT